MVKVMVQRKRGDKRRLRHLNTKHTMKCWPIEVSKQKVTHFFSPFSQLVSGNVIPSINFHCVYSRVPIRRHGMFIRHTSFIRPNTFPKKWAVPYNWISMSNWSTFRYKFVFINLHLLNRPWHLCLLFGTIHEASGDPCLIFRTPLLIGTRE